MRGCRQEKEAVPAGTRNWGHRDGPQHRQPRQEEDISPAGGGGGWRSRLSASAPRPRGPTGGGSGCVEGSREQGDSGRGKTGDRAEGPDAASGCLADIQRQCGYIFWIYKCSCLTVTC